MNEHIPSDALRFDDLMPKELPVWLGGRPYALREASESAAVAYRNVITSGVKIVDGQVSGVGNIAEAQPVLLSQCLYRAEQEGRQGKVPLDAMGNADFRHLVPMSWVKGLPAHIVKQLFDTVKEMSPGLVEEEESADVIRKRIKKDSERLEKLEVKDQNDPLGASGPHVSTTPS